MPDERVLFSLLVRAFLVVVAVTYLVVAFTDYRTYGDARGFRGWIGALTAAFGTLALLPSQVIREQWPAFEELFRALVVIGVLGFIIGITFSAIVGGYSLWRRRRIDG
jgi:hypothetical protein